MRDSPPDKVKFQTRIRSRAAQLRNLPTSLYYEISLIPQKSVCGAAGGPGRDWRGEGSSPKQRRWSRIRETPASAGAASIGEGQVLAFEALLSESLSCCEPWFNVLQLFLPPFSCL